MGFFDRISRAFTGKAADRVMEGAIKMDDRTREQIAKDRIESARKKMAEKKEAAQQKVENARVAALAKKEVAKAGIKAARERVQEGVRAAKESVLEKARAAQEAAREGLEAARRKTQESIIKTKDKAHRVGNFIVVTGLTLPEIAADAKTNALIWGGEVAGKIGRKEDAIYEGAAKKWNDVNEKAGEIRGRASDAVEKFGNKVDETIESGKNKIAELADKARGKRDKFIESIKDRRFAGGVKEIEAAAKKEKAEVTNEYWELIGRSENFMGSTSATETFFELTNTLHIKLDDIDLGVLNDIYRLQEKIYGSKGKVGEKAEQEMPL